MGLSSVNRFGCSWLVCAASLAETPRPGSAERRVTEETEFHRGAEDKSIKKERIAVMRSFSWSSGFSLLLCLLCVRSHLVFLCFRVKSGAMFLYFVVLEVFVIAHAAVNDAVGGDFDNAVSNGFYELMVMRGEEHGAFKLRQTAI